ncbi:hypothetical protein BT96DRAFT_958583 [Gymnopus androsaceus JB14]|uniref:NAD(P)-binding domain-containing protein n=1 Tax=Gymnopus androsaceus JB14 TaxID=1447944 RepID=A0A6A4HDK4_9AGAR|nr:hypothetical protein BT96DRAFT_958583 [Gymnopus androsaceus JB14]
MNVLAAGASKNIGYYASIRILNANCNITFMLRSASVFDSDITIQEMRGDAFIKSDVKCAWDEASTHGAIDPLLFTVGGVPSFQLTEGFVISPANLVTQSLLSTIITISSTGLTRTAHDAAHDALSLPLKPLYGYFLAVPHKDKLGAERAIAYCAGWKWDTAVDALTEKEDWPSAGTLKGVLVIRPALLTDGDCRADSSKNAYRANEEELGGWTILRKDVAHFAVLNRWNEFSDKIVNVAD